MKLFYSVLTVVGVVAMLVPTVVVAFGIATL